mmetsp:Transcript_6647/g.15108  ORF Transcript_6647/g.15108 Transcript_6647/m.15108 type:complete len:306 (+) Transcript_6647:349-1266(+)
MSSASSLPNCPTVSRTACSSHSAVLSSTSWSMKTALGRNLSRMMASSSRRGAGSSPSAAAADSPGSSTSHPPVPARTSVRASAAADADSTTMRTSPILRWRKVLRSILEAISRSAREAASPSARRRSDSWHGDVLDTVSRKSSYLVCAPRKASIDANSACRLSAKDSETDPAARGSASSSSSPPRSCSRPSHSSTASSASPAGSIRSTKNLGAKNTLPPQCAPSSSDVRTSLRSRAFAHSSASGACSGLRHSHPTDLIIRAAWRLRPAGGRSSPAIRAQSAPPSSPATTSRTAERRASSSMSGPR